jgi:hypothetical protein
MADTPSYSIKLDTEITAGLIQRIIQAALKNGFEPISDYGIMYIEVDPQNTLQFNRDWGPASTLQQKLVKHSTDEFSLGLGLEMKKGEFEFYFGFHLDYLMVSQRSDWAKIEGTSFADPVELIRMTYPFIAAQIGEYSIDITMDSD